MAKAKKEYENPLSKEDFVDGKPWWADLWDKGQLTKEQEKQMIDELRALDFYPERKAA